MNSYSEVIKSGNVAAPQNVITSPLSMHTATRLQIPSLPIPRFWEDNPTIWFIHLENIFALSGVTEECLKYSLALSHLDCSHMSEVLGVISSNPGPGCYERLKSELIRKFSPEEAATSQLSIGDCRPSQFLRHLQTLAGAQVPEVLLRSLWIKHLPPALQAVAATQQTVALDDLAQMADKVHDIIMSPAATQTTQAQAASSSNEVILEGLVQQVAALTTCVEKLVSKIESHSPPPRHQRSRSRSPTRNPLEHLNSYFCWYHRRFGDEAEHCKEPCMYRRCRATLAASD